MRVGVEKKCSPVLPLRTGMEIDKSMFVALRTGVEKCSVLLLPIRMEVENECSPVLLVRTGFEIRICLCSAAHGNREMQHLLLQICMPIAIDCSS